MVFDHHNGRHWLYVIVLAVLVTAGVCQATESMGHHPHEQPGIQGLVPPATLPAGASRSEYPIKQCVGYNGKQADCISAVNDAAIEQARDSDWQTYAAIVGVVVGVCTLFAAIAAAKFARNAAIYTAEAAKHAKRSADTADENTKITKEQIRARVAVHPARNTLSAIISQFEVMPTHEPERPKIDLQFQNSGASAAHIINVHANHCVGQAPLESPPFRQGMPDIHFLDRIIFANDLSKVEPIPFRESFGLGVVSQLANGKLAAFFYGCIEYRDIFGLPHITVWCLRSERDGIYREWGGEQYNFRT